MTKTETNTQTKTHRTVQNTNTHIINSPAFGSPSALPCAVYASVRLPTLALLPRGKERKKRGGGGCRYRERGREGHTVARERGNRNRRSQRKRVRKESKTQKDKKKKKNRKLSSYRDSDTKQRDSSWQHSENLYVNRLTSKTHLSPCTYTILQQ